MAKLKVGKMDRGEALIDEGLSPGQPVVVDGQYKLQPGAIVRPAQTNAPDATTPDAEHGDAVGKKSGGKKKKPATWESPPNCLIPINVSNPFIARPVATSPLLAGWILMGPWG